MKIVVGTIVSFVLLLLCGRPLFATECSSDIDCKMYENERCIIPDYAKRGTCVKSTFAPHKEETRPSSDPSSSTRGRFCMTDRDCDQGQSCVKKENAMSGTCR